MFDPNAISAHARGVIVGLFVIVLYWIKELVEFLLRMVYGVDRRLMYVPVAQGVHVDLPFLGNVRLHQRGELFYFVFHMTVSFCLAALFFVLAIFTPPPQEEGYAFFRQE